MQRCLLAGALALGLAIPAFAMSTFYVGLDTTANQCRVMSTEPDGQTMKQLGDTYASYAEAQAAMEGMPECKA